MLRSVAMMKNSKPKPKKEVKVEEKKEESKKEYHLLEELSQVIIQRILEENPQAKSVYIKIRKPFFPIANYQGNGSVIEYVEIR